jgi:hypothetical protein
MTGDASNVMTPDSPAEIGCVLDGAISARFESQVAQSKFFACERRSSRRTQGTVPHNTLRPYIVLASPSALSSSVVTTGRI